MTLFLASLFSFYLSLLLKLCCAAAAAAKSLQSCPPLCDPIDGSPPGSSIPGILQARTLEWVAISLCCEKLSNLAEKGLLVSIRKIINT